MRCSTTFLGLVLAPFAALAAAITAQPLVDADVLEPSVLNEVDHALGRAPTNEVPVSEASVGFAALWATNGASTTERAIALVSSQMGDGRWLFGGKDVTPVAARLLRRAAGYPEPPLKLSIFSSHVEDVARQEGVSFAEAAAKMRAAGIGGLTVAQGLSADRIAAAREAGFTVACVVGWPEFEKRYGVAKCEALVSLAVSNGCSQVMLVPGFYPSAADDAGLFEAITRRTGRFADMAASRGVETLVEDFDDERSPTFGIRRTKAFLESVPAVGFVYDTGNFIGPGERAESGLGLLPRTRHFHLKDRPSYGGRASCAVGSGVVPVARIVSAALDAGYGGWFTIEHFGATNMLESARSSAAFLRAL
jgi:sugar phosphate isomerase/epimerase